MPIGRGSLERLYAIGASQLLEALSLSPQLSRRSAFPPELAPELSGEAKGCLPRDAFLPRQYKEATHDKSIQLDKKRRLSPFLVEERTDDCRGYPLDQCSGAELVRADEAHPRGCQISGPSKQWAAMLRLRPVCGARFMQGGGGSDLCERVVPTIHGEARLRIGLNRAIFSGI